jgi:hypothetical protein
MSQATLDHAKRAEYTLSARPFAVEPRGFRNGLERQLGEYGAGGGNRTHGLGIMRPSLYH